MNPSRVFAREVQEATDDCLECHRVCLHTFSHLLTLETDAEIAEPDQLNLLLDCADICATCADFLLRASAFQTRIADLCCEICRRSQQLCELPGGADPIVRECAAVCARCANSCRRLLATAAAP